MGPGDAPVALFVYARPECLQHTLAGLRANQVPLIYAFSDGPRTAIHTDGVRRVRDILRRIDWAEVVLDERTENRGLGQSILSGVTDVLNRHDRVIVFEDDLICVPGAYRYLAAALDHYRDEPAVMSVTGWTHAKVTPADVDEQPYFDGRAECWLWGTWARAWKGMDLHARSLMRACAANGSDVWRYGADLPAMADAELRQNIWAVRFLYHHMRYGGLCMRPPWSLVEHIGIGAMATNTANDDVLWAAPPLRACPPIPSAWPRPVENASCAGLWQAVYGYRPSLVRRAARVGKQLVRRAVRGGG